MSEGLVFRRVSQNLFPRHVSATVVPRSSRKWLRGWKWIAITVETPEARRPSLASTNVKQSGEYPFNWSLTLCNGFYRRMEKWSNNAHVLSLTSEEGVYGRWIERAPANLLFWGKVAPMLNAETPEDLAGIIKQTPLSIPDGANAGEAWVRAAVKHLQDIGRVRPMNLDEVFHDAQYGAEEVYQSQKTAVTRTPPMIRQYSISDEESLVVAQLSQQPHEQDKSPVRAYTRFLRTIPVDLSRYSQKNGWAGKSRSVHA